MIDYSMQVLCESVWTVAQRKERAFIMGRLTDLAHRNAQVVGEKNDYYVTLWQLEEVLKEQQ